MTRKVAQHLLTTAGTLEAGVSQTRGHVYMCALLAQHRMRQALQRGTLSISMGKCLCFCSSDVFSFCKATQERPFSPSWREALRALCLAPISFGYRKAFMIRPLIRKPRDQKRWKGPSFTRNPWQRGSSSSLDLQCHLLCLHRDSTPSSGRRRV